MRLALLSNINMDPCIRLLGIEADIYAGEGYGNELGILMNPASSLYAYEPDMIFIIEDICELTGHSTDEGTVRESVANWFEAFRSCLKDKLIYYISDAYGWSSELTVIQDKGKKLRLEHIWQQELDKLLKECSNTRIFPYRQLIEQIGEENAFSWKMWYMGRIPHSIAFHQILSKEIIRLSSIENRIPLKVLALDLDNTLWGGLAGEADITPIELSEEHVGLAFKNLQRVILQMKQQGVLLTIVSKNNEEDAWNIIDNHPHMILRREDFAATRINWDNKADNILSLAKELNLGIDSFVFFDDNPTERKLIEDLLPQVIVADYPKSPEELPTAMHKIWRDYFDRPVITQEDREKTSQYQANAARELSRQSAGSFEEYLKGLNIILTRVDEAKHTDRILQLLNKTNQFNLTTRRHSLTELQEYLAAKDKKLFVYRAEDAFGDYGIIAVAVTRLKEETLIIEELVMSCRVMGKLIENAIIHDIETWALAQGKVRILALFRPSAKNQPVKELYRGLGYELIAEAEAGKIADIMTEASDSEYAYYILDLDKQVERSFYLKLGIEA